MSIKLIESAILVSTLRGSYNLFVGSEERYKGLTIKCEIKMDIDCIMYRQYTINDKFTFSHRYTANDVSDSVRVIYKSIGGIDGI